eukprot:g68740.t1
MLKQACPSSYPVYRVLTGKLMHTFAAGTTDSQVTLQCVCAGMEDANVWGRARPEAGVGPVRLLLGALGLLSFAAAAWRATHSQSHTRERGEVQPGPWGPLALVAAPPSPDSHCLFIYSSHMAAPLEGAAPWRADGRLFGAQLGACTEWGWQEPAATWAFPTGVPAHVLAGRVVCWPGAAFASKLAQADQLAGLGWGALDPHNVSHSGPLPIMRSQTPVTLSDGSTQQAFWYHGVCQVCHAPYGHSRQPAAARRKATAAESEPKEGKKKKGKAAKTAAVEGAVGASGVHSARFRLLTGDQADGATAVVEEKLPFKAGGISVIYWMSRDQRVQDNWALLLAQGLAKQHKARLIVAFNLVPRFLEATIRQFDFMLKGLQEVEAELRALHIAFYLLRGLPEHTMPVFAQAQGAGIVVCDMSPLRVPRMWVLNTAKGLLQHGVHTVQVDAHNVEPKPGRLGKDAKTRRAA